MFGRRGQRKVGLSGSGGVETPNPRPMPCGGKMEVGVPPLAPELRMVVPPMGGIPGGARGGESTPGMCDPTELVCEVGMIGARPPRPRLVELPRDEEVWLDGPEYDWPTGYISNLILEALCRRSCANFDDSNVSPLSLGIWPSRQVSREPASLVEHVLVFHLAS